MRQSRCTVAGHAIRKQDQREYRYGTAAALPAEPGSDGSSAPKCTIGPLAGRQSVACIERSGDQVTRDRACQSGKASSTCLRAWASVMPVTATRCLFTGPQGAANGRNADPEPRPAIPQVPGPADLASVSRRHSHPPHRVVPAGRTRLLMITVNHPGQPRDRADDSAGTAPRALEATVERVLDALRGARMSAGSPSLGEAGPPRPTRRWWRCTKQRSVTARKGARKEGTGIASTPRPRAVGDPVAEIEQLQDQDGPDHH
jgi:hypothetical protein